MKAYLKASRKAFLFPSLTSLFHLTGVFALQLYDQDKGR